ncbi:MAG: RNA polymerase factor sigma-54 [Candidatus Eisenbacteria bacterium]|nr:RNA polymerase factor sigma-54 [Candidatus Eisenbacteria bacterium]
MELKQSLGMHQQLVMTPRLQMALKILQVSTLELEQFLKQELLQNPLLERLDDDDESEGESSEETEQASESEKEQSSDEERESSSEGDSETAEEESSADDLDWDDYLDDIYAHAYGQNLARDDDDERFERVPVAVATFEDALKSQLHMECSDDALVGIAEYIIDELDADGFVADPLEVIAETLKVPLEDVERALEVVQSLDPPGIGARSLEESLLLQLQRKDLGDGLAARVVREAFAELKNCKYDQIRRRLGVTKDDLREAINEISKLDPRPRTDPSSGDVAYITPDLVIEEVDGDYVVYLNDQDVPRVRISPTYRRMLGGKAAPEEREFITKKLKAARWIVQSIENRRRTMVRVTESILRAQREFFQKGVSALKPLTLQQIADDVGMHESTVSRVTRGKYVQTPRGTFELKYFFSSGIRTRDGEEVASKAVRDSMREIISKEDKQKPLSDQKIAEELKRMGFSISRRAVAKYRDQMRILRAGLRKEI